MRRTLFVFPRDLLPAAWGSASARVAAPARARLAKDVEEAGLADDGEAWLDARRAAVLARLARRRASCPPRRSASGCPSWPAGRAGAGQGLRRRRPDRAAGAHPARRRAA